MSQPAAAPPPGRTPAAEPVLDARGLTKRYGRRTALDGVSVTARAGQRLAVIGPNGAGKTTLLSLLAGEQRPDAGEVGREPAQIGWVPQQVALYGRLTVAENLRLFARLERCRDVEGAVKRMLAQAGLEDRADEQVGRLSGGNRQRVNIAIGLIASPQVLLLDEPSTALDPRQRERLWEFLESLAGEGTSIVYSTHNVQEAEHHADEVMVLADGQVVFSGSPGELERHVGGTDLGFEAAFVSFLRQRGH